MYRPVNAKNDVSAAQHAENQRVLRQILQQDGNKLCADCQTRAPRWASVNLGIFICLECAGIHRNLGVHISQVRSTDMDKWLPEQVLFVRLMGNAKANAYWEARLSGPRPRSTDRYFIEKKYAMKAFSAKEATPPTLDRFLRGELPHLAQETRQAAPEAPASVAPSQSQPRATSAPSVSSTPMPPPEIDLLGLDDAPTSAPAPAAGTSQLPATSATATSPVHHQSASANADLEGWAAFEGAPAATTPANPAPEPRGGGVAGVSGRGDGQWMPFGDAQRQDKEGQALPTHAHAKSLGGVLTAPGTQDPFAPAAQGQRQEMEQHVAHRHSSSLPQMPTASTPAKKLTNDDILSLFDAAPSPHFARTPPPRHPQAFPGHAHAVHASASPLGAHQPYAGVSGTPHAPANTPARMQVPHGAGMGHGGAGVGGAGMLGPGLAGGSGLTPLGGGSGVGVGSLVGAGTGGGASAGQGGGTGPSWSMAPPQGGSGTGGSGNGAVWSLSAHKQGQTTAGGHGGGLW